jgi:hypothetical protein
MNLSNSIHYELNEDVNVFIIEVSKQFSIDTNVLLEIFEKGTTKDQNSPKFDPLFDAFLIKLHDTTYILQTQYGPVIATLNDTKIEPLTEEEKEICDKFNFKCVEIE